MIEKKAWCFALYLMFGRQYHSFLHLKVATLLFLRRLQGFSFVLFLYHPIFCCFKELNYQHIPPVVIHMREIMSLWKMALG